MVKEAWSSLKDNIKDRITNPFLGTFVIVWIAHNWEVVYSFFYFDKDWKLESKIQYFKDYWSDKSFFWDLMCVAAITVCILVITYLFLAISRYLAKIFENIIIPFITKISRGEIVTAETHQNALDRIIALEAKVEAERKVKNEALQEVDNLEKRLYQPKQESSENDDLSINLYKNKVYKDESGILYFIDKKGEYHLLPDKQTADFLESNEGQLEIEKSELEKRFAKGNDFESVLSEKAELVWVDNTHIFVILDGRRFHVPSWDYLYNWKRTDKNKYISITEEDLYTKYPEGR